MASRLTTIYRNQEIAGSTPAVVTMQEKLDNLFVSLIRFINMEDKDMIVDVELFSAPATSHFLCFPLKSLILVSIESRHYKKPRS